MPNVKFEFQFDPLTGKVFVCPEYWNEDIANKIKQMFPNSDIQFPSEAEHVGQKRDLCG